MRGAVGNHMRFCGVLRTITNKSLSLSLSTLPPCRTLSSFVKDGWEFSARNCRASDRLGDPDLRFRGYSIYDSEFCIKHLDSGLKFSFNAYDALLKSDQERRNGDPLRSSTMPSYGSPFLSLIDRQYDSAYVGNIFFEEAGKNPKNIINLNWELIDWKTLHEQFQWVIENERISTIPIKYTSFDGSTFFVANRKEGKKSNGLLSPLMPLYVDLDPTEEEKSCCNFSLVVTDYGWFARLYQLFNSYFGDTRERIMTMHCNFEKNTIYREIVEQQSENFETRVPQLKDSNCLDESSPLSFVHFHETKQLKIQEPSFMRGCDSSFPVHDVARYSSLAVDEWKNAVLEDFNVPDHTIALLLSNRGEKFEAFERTERARLQIVPFFRHPYNPLAMDRSVGTIKNVYLLGTNIKNGSRRKFLIFDDEEDDYYYET